MVFTLTDVLTKMMNFKNVFRWHFPFLILLSLVSVRALAADTLLVLGDSLSAGYRIPAARAWPVLLAARWQQDDNAIRVVNASISGDTAPQGVALLPALLRQHKPRWVVIELGGNDGLRGFPTSQIEQDLVKAITLSKPTGGRAAPAHANPPTAELRQALYGNIQRHLSGAGEPVRRSLTDVLYGMEQVYLRPEWMQDDGIHPNPDAQPFIAQWMADRLLPLLKHES